MRISFGEARLCHSRYGVATSKTSRYLSIRICYCYSTRAGEPLLPASVRNAPWGEADGHRRWARKSHPSQYIVCVSRKAGADLHTDLSIELCQVRNHCLTAICCSIGSPFLGARSKSRATSRACRQILGRSLLGRTPRENEARQANLSARAPLKLICSGSRDAR